MQHHVLFSSLWPCIRNAEKQKLNEWRIQNVSWCGCGCLASSPCSQGCVAGICQHPFQHIHPSPGKSQPPHDFPFNLPLLRLSSLSLSCWQTTLTWAKDKQFRPPFHSQGCRDSLWIEAWCYSIKFRSIHPQSIYNMVLMGGGWGLSERHSTLS